MLCIFCAWYIRFDCVLSCPTRAYVSLSQNRCLCTSLIFRSTLCWLTSCCLGSGVSTSQTQQPHTSQVLPPEEALYLRKKKRKLTRQDPYARFSALLYRRLPQDDQKAILASMDTVDPDHATFLWGPREQATLFPKPTGSALSFPPPQLCPISTPHLPIHAFYFFFFFLFWKLSFHKIMLVGSVPRFCSSARLPQTEN